MDELLYGNARIKMYLPFVKVMGNPEKQIRLDSRA